MKNAIIYFVSVIISQMTYCQYPATVQKNKIASNIVFDTVYYKSGAVWKIIPYVDNVMHGEQTWYDEAGNIRVLINFKNNKKDGPWIEYYDYGFFKITGYYSNDARDSIWVENHYNRRMKSYGRYTPNINYLIVREIDGRQYIYTQDSSFTIIDSVLLTMELVADLTNLYGNPETHSIGFPVEIHFKDKKWEYWNENGILIKEEFWDKGKLISVIDY